jgi:Tfp pilus assembly protein PilN
MIKVNLVGITTRKKAVKPSMKVSMPSNFTPVLLLVIVVGFAAGGYLWYASLTHQSDDLSQQIRGLEERKAALDAVIKQDQVFATVKKKLENRVKIVETLTKNQVSPVLLLDQLAEAVERTQWVWLQTLEQKDAVLSMTGTGISLNAIADFYTNLNATGYFKNIDLGTTQEMAGNYTFSLKCEFAPPRRAEIATSGAAGGN